MKILRIFSIQARTAATKCPNTISRSALDIFQRQRKMCVNFSTVNHFWSFLPLFTFFLFVSGNYDHDTAVFIQRRDGEYHIIHFNPNKDVRCRATEKLYELPSAATMIQMATLVAAVQP